MPKDIPDKVYKILPRTIADAVRVTGALGRTGIDVADGYIHLSTQDQVQGTLNAHFQGQADLVLLEIEPDACFGRFKLEASRGGALVPHLYGAAPAEAISRRFDLDLGEDGVPQAPDLSPLRSTDRG